MKLASCCTKLIASYIAINPKEYPRDGAALHCPGCLSRVTYHNKKWRTEQPPVQVIIGDREAKILDAKQGLVQEPRPKKGGLLDALD